MIKLKKLLNDHFMIILLNFIENLYFRKNKILKKLL